MKIPNTFITRNNEYKRSKRPLGEGGNSIVFEVTCRKGNNYAIKLQKANILDRQKIRFKNEIDILSRLKNHNGVIKLHDFSYQNDMHLPFYIIDLGISAFAWCQSKKDAEIIAAFLEISKTLKQLQEDKISHRDIKPDNIIFINNTPYLADFGLAHEENKQRLTLEGDKQIGAKLTMAPEMIHYPYHANYYKSDVYSLAKSLWILLTKDNNCFEGCYNTHSKESLWNYDIEVFGEIEIFLEKCTHNSPDERWSYDKIISFFEHWLSIADDHVNCRKESWRHLKRRIFPFSQPEMAEWTELNDITKILNIICSKSYWNHTFLPDGGGLDFTSVRKSDEDGCIEFEMQGFCNIIRPLKLCFYSPEGELHGEEDYFLLIADELDFISNEQLELKEIITQLSKTEYTQEECYNWDDFNGETLPQDARKVIRWRGGKFAIFMGSSRYNQKGIYIDGKLINAYSGFHNTIDETEFFNYFKALFRIKPKKIYNSIYLTPKSTRLKRKILTKTQLKIINSFITNISTIDDKDSQNNSESNGIIDFKNIFCIDKRATIIEGLSGQDLQLINAVMYSGRENRPPYGIPLDDQLQYYNNPEDNRQSLLNIKISLICSDLKRGIEMFT